jgi:hypothetical protein
MSSSSRSPGIRSDAVRWIRHVNAGAPKLPWYTPKKEFATLEGHFSAHSGHWTVRPWCAASRQAITSLLLVLFLLTPIGSSVLQQFGRDDSSCGMKCCKLTKACCCRKASHSGHDGSPAWKSSSKCPDGCGQAPVVQSAATASLGPERRDAAPVAVAQARRMSAPAIRDSGAAFALFERPPPRSA